MSITPRARTVDWSEECPVWVAWQATEGGDDEEDAEDGEDGRMITSCATRRPEVGAVR